VSVIAPPLPALLPVNWLSLTVSVELDAIAPPTPVAELFTKMHRETVSVPRSRIAPPLPAFPPLPLIICRSLIWTVRPGTTSSMLIDGLVLAGSSVAPSPLIVRLTEIVSPGLAIW
jgi:hypothetical protein